MNRKIWLPLESMKQEDWNRIWEDEEKRKKAIRQIRDEIFHGNNDIIIGKPMNLSEAKKIRDIEKSC